MTTKDNKSLVRHLVEEGFNKSNLAAIDELLADNFIDHNPLPGLPPLPPGPAGFKQLATMFRTAFPDLLYTIEDMVADGDKVVIRYSACGTNTGELVGMPPSGEQVAVTGFDMFRITNDRIVEWWHCDDYLSLLQQLGMLPHLGYMG